MENIPIGGKINIKDLKPGSYTVLGNALALQPKSKKSLGQNILDAGTSVANFFGAKGISESIGADFAKTFAKDDEFSTKEEKQSYITQPTLKEKIGSVIQTGANFIPGAGIGAGLARKVAVGAATGLAFDVGSQLQDKNKKATDVRPGIGTAIGGALPVAGAVVGVGTRILGRLFKGLGAGLSGVSTKTLDSIIENPKVAQQASKKLALAGNSKILEDNAKQIINGVSTIKQQARKAFGKGLEELSETDIAPDIFRKQTQSVLEKYGSTLQKGKRVLTGVEFNDPKNVKKASDLIKELSNVKLDGKSIRKLADDIESSAYKIATSDERLSFNAFINDLSDSLKGAVSSSTSKLDDINAKFSQDMQLAGAVENIFGKVKYKNIAEVAKASQKLETLFSQKGLAPDVIDDFLARIGVDAKDFRTGEAIRQISTKEPMSPNAPGFNVGEIFRTATGSIVTPESVKNISIGAGMSKEKLASLLNNMNPAARDIAIQTLLPEQQVAKVSSSPDVIKNLAIATGLAKDELVPFLNSLAPAARNALIQALLQDQQ